MGGTVPWTAWTHLQHEVAVPVPSDLLAGSHLLQHLLRVGRRLELGFLPLQPDAFVTCVRQLDTEQQVKVRMAKTIKGKLHNFTVDASVAEAANALPVAEAPLLFSRLAFALSRSSSYSLSFACFTLRLCKRVSSCPTPVRWPSTGALSAITRSNSRSNISGRSRWVFAEL